MRPADAKFLLDFLLPQFQSEHAVTLRSSIRAVPGGGRDYRARAQGHERVRTAAACRDLRIVVPRCHPPWRSLAKGRRRPPRLRPDVPGTRRLVWRRVFASSPGATDRAAASGEDLAREIDYIGLRNDPAVAYLNIAIRHSVHHRGQLAAYLRGMGAASARDLCGERGRALSAGRRQHRDAAGILKLHPDGVVLVA
jgi:hypothetical protein